MSETLSTRIVFFIAGIVTAAWAVIVPFARINTGVNEALLGTLLLCLGFGAIVAMPLTGTLTSRWGCRAVITAATCIILFSIPFLAVVSSPILLALSLLIFGVGVGITDCAMNVQAILVEKLSDKPVMSSFHGMFSAGGIAGAGIMTGLMSSGLSVVSATLAVVATVSLLLLLSYKGMLPYANPAEGPVFAIPRGTVLILGLICFIFFMAEGTVLDWSALYLVESRHLPDTLGGLGFAAFATAMTIGRLSGDRIVAKYGSLKVVMAGSSTAITGFLLVINAETLPVVLLGYLLIGAGCANVVPIMFTQIGKQTSMPQMVAVPAVTTLGYIGVLAGPAIIGYIAHHSSVTHGFILVTGLMVFAAILSFSIRKLLESRSLE
ncbi:MFS transporter [Erwinia tracheiphila]|uniref:MFS transporter n=1 Tax=Erwinia tracheiphila TaxID=65700 RepID=A0A0M2KEC7_9GAMM|nr:MFS transporter [Erwinia tracheiphila]EOS93783.1 MFS family transporter [Erwinia tracheiphila PSU-1]KKF35573.1 MFS transporter [Erwinia tracheiphila]UIA89749.1 MFS transporter [Erwinia tracheiphila]UIA98050.1 MFS transporter [Erwinia tracheiphila]